MLVVAAAAGAIWAGLRHEASNHVFLTFHRQDQPAPPLTLTFYPDRLAFTAISPPPPIGQLAVAAGDSITVGNDLVPSRGVVCYRGDGIGTGFVHVRLGESVRPIPLRTPATIRGRVGDPLAIWAHGWRCPGLRPVAGAEVTVMGGGEHGVPLAHGLTDAEGNFVIDGVDGQLDGLGVRVKARGYALTNEAVRPAGPGGHAVTVVALGRAATHTGKIEAPPDVDPTTLRVLARGLPGVDATPAPDGTFALDHVPVGMEPRLLVHGLPPTRTHAPARARANQPALIVIVPAAIVHGRVVDAATLQPLAQALVWCDDQDPVRSDDDGNFELVRQLPGDVELQAQWDFVDSRRRRQPWFGRQRIVLEANRAHDGVDILVAAR